MGSNDIPPAYVNSHFMPVHNSLLQLGGSLWTLCYILLIRESWRSKSYGMPLFALAMNFGWELVYVLSIVETTLERVVFTTWLIVDCGILLGMLKFGANEWKHAPHIGRNLLPIFVLSTLVAAAGNWTFAKWFLDLEIGKREGKFFRGKVGPDTTMLGFWSSVVAQAYMSAACLAQLLVRMHSGGVSWGVWATRTLGTLSGLYLNYAWLWYGWREANEYVMSPFAIFLSAVGFGCDLGFGLLLWYVKKTELVLPDGRKIRGGSVENESIRKSL